MLLVTGWVLQVSDAPKVGGDKSHILSQPHVPALASLGNESAPSYGTSTQGWGWPPGSVSVSEDCAGLGRISRWVQDLPCISLHCSLGAGHAWSDPEIRCARSQSCCSLTSLFSGSWLLCGPHPNRSWSLVQHSQLFVQGMFLCQAESGCFLVAGEVANPRSKMPKLG